MGGLDSSRVVIVGGGIGGVASALALSKQGAEVVVLERTAEFGEVGAGLQVGPHGARILESWGVLDEVLSHGFLPNNLVFRDALTAEELTRVSLGKDFRERYGGPYFVSHRSDLHAVLRRAARKEGADLRSGVTVTDVVTDGDTAIVSTEDGETFAGDVALGMDGLKSRLRAKVSSDQPVTTGYVAYRGAFPYHEVAIGEDISDVVGYIGPGCHFIRYPLRGGEMLNQVAVFQSPSFRHGSPNWGGPDELEAAFDQCHISVRRGIDHLWRDRWWPMYDRDPIDTWVDGRMILLGDAAHPPLQYLASGAVMALEDAKCIADYAVQDDRPGGAPVAWPRILKEVNDERASRCNRIITTGRMWGELWHLDGTARIARNELFRTRDVNSYRYTDWLWGYSSDRHRHVAD